MNHADIHPVIGMSPWNPYFKQEVVNNLLKTVIGRFGRTAILIADIPAISTYKALWYPENRARKDKAIPKGNVLKNRVKLAMLRFGYSDEVVKIIDWKKQVENDASYRKMYAKIENLYTDNREFRISANATTQSVLEGSGRIIENIEGATETAVHYLLSEIAFLEFANILLKTETVTYIYHKNWPIYEDYVAGKFDGIPKSSMDFLLL